jgi:outer membrane protein assembly factor BamB
MRLSIFLGLLLSLMACANFEKATRPHAFFERVWTKDLDAPEYGEGNLAVALNSPLALAKQNLILVGNASGHMQAWQLASGKMQWQQTDQATQLTAPLLSPDAKLVIYGTAQGRVNARDVKSGELRYTINLGSPIIAPGKIDHGRIFFQLGNHQLMCLDALTGKILWSYKRAVPYFLTLQKAANPIVFDGKVLVGEADGTLVALRLEDGSLLWEAKLAVGGRFVDVDVNPYVVKGTVFAAATGGDLQKLDLKTGKMLARAEFSPAVTPLAWQGDRLAATRDGRLVVYADNLAIKRQATVTTQAITALAIWKAHAIVATDDGFIKAYDLKDFKLKGSFHLGHDYSTVLGDLAVTDKYLAVLSSRYHLYVFQ